LLQYDAHNGYINYSHQHDARDVHSIDLEDNCDDYFTGSDDIYDESG
jgi:hypothetical protein